MSTSQIIACAISWTAAAAALWALLSVRRTARQLRAERRTFTTPGGGEITVTAPMSDADYEAFKARWQATYKPDRAHPVKPLDEPGAVCPAYQPPTTAADSGLCARCGMYDYKHQEQPRV